MFEISTIDDVSYELGPYRSDVETYYFSLVQNYLFIAALQIRNAAYSALWLPLTGLLLD